MIVAVFMFDIVVVVVFNFLNEMKIGNGRRVKQRDEGEYEVEELKTEKDRRKGSKGRRRKTERERERERGGGGGGWRVRLLSTLSGARYPDSSIFHTYPLSQPCPVSFYLQKHLPRGFSRALT